MVDLLPNYAWDIVKAGIAAGYKKSYATTQLKGIVLSNQSICKKIDEQRTKITAASMNEVELVKQTMRNIIDGKGSTANKIRAADILMKIAGVYSEKRVIETTHRTRELDAAEKQEALSIAAVRLRLPAPQHVVSDIIDSGTGTAPETEAKEDVNNDATEHTEQQ